MPTAAPLHETHAEHRPSAPSPVFPHASLPGEDRASPAYTVAHDMDVIESLRLPSGLVRAAPGAEYDRVWIRDNCYLGLAYWLTGERKKAVTLFRGLLKIVERYDWKIDYVLWEGRPAFDYKRLHPRYDTTGMEIPDPWGFAQNDCVGLLLWCVGFLESEGAKLTSFLDRHRIQKLVWYLQAIRYWDDADNGVWEESKEVHASSLGCCLAGLRMGVGGTAVPDPLIRYGEAALAALSGRESAEHAVDLAQLTLVWPLGIAGSEVVEAVEHALLREQGVIRYAGDTYHRGSAEAEWTMGIPWLGLCWKTLGDDTRARHYLAETDRVRLPNGQLPEAYIPQGHDHRIYQPCDHTPLAWSHALAALLRAALDGSAPAHPAETLELDALLA